MTTLTKRSKNIGQSEYVFHEKRFLELCTLGLINYWNPLRWDRLSAMREGLNSKDYPSERWFEKSLKEKQIKGFLRNWPIANRFFADFYFPRANLVIEIDGKGHDRRQDSARDRIFKLFHIKVIRITYLNEIKLKATIEKLAKNERCRHGFKLQRKKISAIDKYQFFPPEILPVKPTPELFAPKPKVYLIRKADHRNEIRIEKPAEIG